MTENAQQIRRVFSQVYILGGSPCSGKSTIAEKLSSRYRFRYYKVDDFEREHLSRCHPERHPVMYKYSKMSWNEIWSRPVQVQVREEFEFYRERFEMILEDLQKYEPGTPVILEGAAYLPELIAKYDVDPNHVIYLVPTKAFQMHHYSQRPWIRHILKECHDPDQAFENWMERDHRFGQEIIRQAKAYGLGTVIVDGKRNIDTQYDFVVRHFGLS
jgi:2-phosphoglycerate kinase